MAHLKLNREKLVDTLSERWLFEKRSIELYDAVIDKLERHGHHAEGRQLRRYREQEEEHCRLLESYIEKLGGSTTHATPSQRPVELEARAFQAIVGEARGPAQLLHVILAAELEDNASWELLIGLAQEAGAHELIDAFDHAMRQEREHLSGVKALVAEQARRELVEAPGEREPLIPLI